MASPLAHSLIGASIYFAGLKSGSRGAGIALLVIIAASLADLDFIPGLLIGSPGQFHRGITHSFAFWIVPAAILFVWLKFSGTPQAARISVLFLLSCSSHILIDWLSYDDAVPFGVPAFWPFSDSYSMAEITPFMHIERDNVFHPATIRHNLVACLYEVLILGPVLAVVVIYDRKK